VPRGGVHHVRSGRHALLQGAWRGQALPRGGVHHVSCYRRDATLHRAWRGQAVPTRGLLQECSRRRHTPLQGARRRQALPARGLLQERSRRHATLLGAWRRQALPRGGVLKGSCWRHATLHRARWGQAVPARGLLQGSRSSSRQHALPAMSAAHTAAARRCGGASTLSSGAATQLARTRGDPAAGGGLRINQFTAEASLAADRRYVYAPLAMTHLKQPAVLGRRFHAFHNF
jgi:hypothetical protein